MKKIIKSTLCFVLSFVICFGCFANTVFASDLTIIEYIESFNNGWTYSQSLDADVHLYLSGNLEKGTIVSVKLQFAQPYYRYNADYIYLNGSKNGVSYDFVCTDIEYNGNTYIFDFVITSDCVANSVWIVWGEELCTYTCPGSTIINNRLISYDLSVQSESQSLSKKLSNLFSSLFGWLQDIRDKLVNLASNFASSISGLGDRISSFFTNLINDIRTRFNDLTASISGFFSNLTNNLRDWFSNVGNWFVSLGESISGFFEKLWNRIYYGNENGASEYQKPVINNKLNDILDTLDGYQVQLKGTIDTISTSADSVSEYISTGTALINGILNVAGAGFTAVIIFGMVFVLVRKVVGR